MARKGKDIVKDVVSVPRGSGIDAIVKGVNETAKKSIKRGKIAEKKLESGNVTVEYIS